jgi:hypothetical protein
MQSGPVPESPVSLNSTQFFPFCTPVRDALGLITGYVALLLSMTMVGCGISEDRLPFFPSFHTSW